MEWKKSKLTRWQAGPFTITEEAGPRPFRLDGPDDHPQHFETLTEAKAHASTLNELNLQRDEVARLRAELDELRHPGRWPAAINQVEGAAGDGRGKDCVDVVVTNPPFGGMEEDGIETNFPAAYRTKETADLFLVLLMHILKLNGRAGIVLPDGTLFGEGIKTRIKEKLLDECNLHTIVRLPNGVFAPYTSIKTNLLFLTKGEKTKDIWYYEHPYPLGFKSYSKTKPIRIEEFEPEKKWWKKRKASEHAWKVSIAEIKANGYNLDIKNPHDAGAGDADPDALLAEYQTLQAQIAATRDQLKDELRAALEGKPA